MHPSLRRLRLPLCGLLAGALLLPPDAARSAEPAVAAPATAPPTATAYPSEAAALAAILAQVSSDGGPQVIAFGEYHETTADAKKKAAGHGVPSALLRFGQKLLPTLAPLASDLVLETWITDGSCGKQESAAVADVTKTTERPASTESELVTLVKQVKGLGITPHILKLSCADYKALVDTGAEVDYEKLLKLITELLHKKIVEVAQRRQTAGDKRFLMVYGGAVHNDLVPTPLLADYSFGPATDKDFPGRYVEIDLYVPEFVERDGSLRKEPWYPQYVKRARPGQSVVIHRGGSDGQKPHHSYILLFPRGAKR